MHGIPKTNLYSSLGSKRVFFDVFFWATKTRRFFFGEITGEDRLEGFFFFFPDSWILPVFDVFFFKITKAPGGSPTGKFPTVVF